MSWVITGSEKTPVDTQFGSVSLLLHGDGANGSTTIIDSSPTPKTITCFNGASISTDQSRFGISSINFPNSANTYLTSTSGPEFTFGRSPWTVEAWVFQRTKALNATLLEIGPHGPSTGFAIFVGSSGFRVYSGNFFGSGGSLPVNDWIHLAVTQDGSTLRFFAGGILTSSASFTNNLTVNSPIAIGYPIGQVPTATNTDYRFDGYIDDLRITKGVARYTSNFTPPTAPFPDI